jgi:hypothetical protein
MIEIKKSSEDSRGKMFVFTEDDKRVAHLMTLKAGASVGGHYHDEPEKVVVLDGEIKYSIIKFDGKGKETKGVLAKDQNLDIQPWNAHVFTANEDSLIICFIGECENSGYSPYRAIVENSTKINNSEKQN